ncbi:MAG: hypothetical protein IT208_00740 [Chthonomonadales bacterium]|nr:hypothetical protein [Chthonomonadales bacterium]
MGADGELVPYGSFGSAAGATSSRDTAAGWLFMVSTVTVLVVGAMGFRRWRRAVARR